MSPTPQRVCVRVLTTLLGLCLASAALAQSGTWESRAPLAVPTYALGAAWADGRMYAVSGYYNGRVTAYDPGDDSWTDVAPLPQTLQYFGIAALGHDIYVVGGDTGGGGWVASLYRYNTQSNDWATLASMPGGARYLVRAAALGGKIYAVGGTDGSSSLGRLEVYDPATGAWSTLAPMPTPRYGAAVGVFDGKLYVAGGGTPAETGVLEIYDPASDSWSSGPAMPTPRPCGGAVANGRLFAVSGGPNDNTVESYDPLSNSWQAEAPMLTFGHDTGVAGDPATGVLYAVGGWNGGYRAANEAYVPDAPPAGEFLVLVSDEPAGANCPAGGVRVVTGEDVDGDGDLLGAEIDSITFVCDGADGRTGLVAVTPEAAGGNCPAGGSLIQSGLDDDGDGTLDPEEVRASAYACQGQPGDDGQDGAPGASSVLVVSAEPAGANCPAGGTRVDSGLDLDGDGVLSAGEIQATFYVCNGQDGQDGANGQDGVNGQDGASSLVDIADEAPGVNCPEGGKRIQSGLDQDGDGHLDPEEIADTDYLCIPMGGDGGGCATGGPGGGLLALLLLGAAALYRRRAASRRA